MNYNTQMPPIREPKVLIVDDDYDTLIVLSALFERCGAKVVTVSMGLIAIDEYLAREESENKFDLMVFDIRMPEINGNELAKRVRNIGYTGPLVALTAAASGEGHVESSNSGFNCYYHKNQISQKLISHLFEKYLN